MSMQACANFARRELGESISNRASSVADQRSRFGRFNRKVESMFSTSKPCSRTILWTIAILVALKLGGEPARAGEKEDRITTLTERVELLEKLIIKDSFHPDKTVLARLESVEENVKGLTKSGVVDGKADDKAQNDLQRSLKETQRNIEQIERRLKAAEQDKPAGGDTADLRELRRDLKNVQSTVDALGDRVRKLEAKR